MSEPKNHHWLPRFLLRKWTSGNANLDELVPPADRRTPAVTILDGHLLALGWIGNVLQAPVRSLGVTDFGESAALPDLYHKHRIDADAIFGAINNCYLSRGSEDGRRSCDSHAHGCGALLYEPPRHAGQ